MIAYTRHAVSYTMAKVARRQETMSRAKSKPGEPGTNGMPKAFLALGVSGLGCRAEHIAQTQNPPINQVCFLHDPMLFRLACCC